MYNKECKHNIYDPESDSQYLAHREYRYSDLTLVRKYSENPSFYCNMTLLQEPNTKNILIEKVYGQSQDTVRGVDMVMNRSTALAVSRLTWLSQFQLQKIGFQMPELVQACPVLLQRNSDEAINSTEKNEKFGVRTIQQFIEGCTLHDWWVNSARTQDFGTQEYIFNFFMDLLHKNYQFTPQTTDRHLFPYRPRDKTHFHDLLYNDKRFEGSSGLYTIPPINETQINVSFDAKPANFVHSAADGKIYYVDITPPFTQRYDGFSGLITVNPNAAKEKPEREKRLLTKSGIHYIAIKLCAELAGALFEISDVNNTKKTFDDLLSKMKEYVENNYQNTAVMQAIDYEIQNNFPYFRSSIGKNEKERWGYLMTEF